MPGSPDMSGRKPFPKKKMGIQKQPDNVWTGPKLKRPA